VRPVSDRLAPVALAGPRPAGPVTPYAARAYGQAARAGTSLVAHDPSRRPDRSTGRPVDPAADASRALLAARPAALGVETEVSIRMYADGGSISVVRHLRDGETVGIEALIR
jgi:hypothetical protein